MATAQVEAWVGARKGSIHEAARSIDASLADAALGRMMLHRRRAVAASVISAFFARVGTGYAPYLEGRSSAAPLDPAGERAIAARAGELAATFCGMPPPLAFERALLAESDGRFGDAQADLKQVLCGLSRFRCGGYCGRANGARGRRAGGGDSPARSGGGRDHPYPRWRRSCWRMPFGRSVCTSRRAGTISRRFFVVAGMTATATIVRQSI